MRSRFPLLAFALAILVGPGAFATEFVIAQSHMDSTIRVLELDPNTDAVVANHVFTQPAAAPHQFVVTASKGAVKTLFAIGLDGTTVWVSDMPAPGAVGAFNAVATPKLAAIAPYSSDSVIGVTKQNEVLLISKSGGVKQLLPASAIPVSKYSSVFKLSRISGDRYAMIAERTLFVVNVANAAAAIEKEFVFTDGPSIKSSLSTITVNFLWDVVADDKRVWVNAEFLDGMGAMRHAAVLVDLKSGVESMFRLHSSVAARFVGIDSATGNLVVRTDVDLSTYDRNGSAVAKKLDRFKPSKLIANGAAASAPWSVLDPVEPSEFRDLMKFEESKNPALARRSILKNVVVTASELAAYVKPTNALIYYFKNVRDELAQHGLEYNYDELFVLPGHENTPIAIGELLELLSRGAKAELAQKQCAGVLTKP